MSYLVLRIAAPVILTIISLGIAATVDYSMRANAAPGGMTIGEYLGDLPQRAKIALADEAPKPKMAALVPAPPAGWSQRDIADTDYAILTGIAPKEVVVNPSAEALEKELEGNLVFNLMRAQQTRGFDGAAQAYVGPGQMILYSARYAPARVTNGIGGRQMGMMIDLMNMEFAPQDFASVQGVKFQVVAIEGTDKARKIKAQLRRQVFIELVTNADDATVIAFLDQMDMAQFNAMMAEPIANIGREQPTLNALEMAESAEYAAQQAAAEAQAETLAKARALAANFSGTTRRERKILQALIDGDVTTLQEAEITFGALHDVNPEIVGLFRIETEQEIRVRTAAATQAMADQASSGQAATSVAANGDAEEPAARPNVRRGNQRGGLAGAVGSCGLEIGTKRCVIATEEPQTE